MNILCWKNTLATVIAKMQTRFPNEFNFIPKTYLLPEENCKVEADEERYKKEGRKYFFIVKPENSCQGKGIILCRGMEDIKNMGAEETRFVCQK